MISTTAGKEEFRHYVSSLMNLGMHEAVAQAIDEVGYSEAKFALLTEVHFGIDMDPLDYSHKVTLVERDLGLDRIAIRMTFHERLPYHWKASWRRLWVGQFDKMHWYVRCLGRWQEGSESSKRGDLFLGEAIMLTVDGHVRVPLVGSSGSFVDAIEKENV